MYHIIREAALKSDYFTETPSGYQLVFRVAVDDGVSPTQSLLDLLVPAGAPIVPRLLATYDGSSPSLKGSWVFLSVTARFAETSQEVCMEYLDLVEVVLDNLPDGSDTLAAALIVVSGWRPSQNPQHPPLRDDDR